MDARLTHTACSCSYNVANAAGLRHHVSPVAARCPIRSVRTSQAFVPAPFPPNGLQHRSSRVVPCSAGKSKTEIGGYTPATYISYSEDEKHTCHHLVAVEVDAPASVCYQLWNDWHRLVDFLDLIAQIGLDPDKPQLALLQCFYRWGQLPVMEIVMVLQKIAAVENEFIIFTSVWGLPCNGEVSFVEDEGKTQVIFKFAHQLPNLLVDLQVGVFGVESQMREIFTENMLVFKAVAESIAREPSKAPARKDAEPTQGDEFPWAQVPEESDEDEDEGEYQGEGLDDSEALDGFEDENEFNNSYDAAAAAMQQRAGQQQPAAATSLPQSNGAPSAPAASKKGLRRAAATSKQSASAASEPVDDLVKTTRDRRRAAAAS